MSPQDELKDRVEAKKLRLQAKLDALSKNRKGYRIPEL
jgi:hypothetical protein